MHTHYILCSVYAIHIYTHPEGWESNIDNKGKKKKKRKFLKTQVEAENF